MRIARLTREEVTDLCQLCAAEPGTLDHRFVCMATLLDEGWPTSPVETQVFTERLSEGRSMLHSTRALAVKIELEDPPQYGWLRWLRAVPEKSPGLFEHVIGGSLVDGSTPFARAGCAIVVIDERWRLVAFAYGTPPGGRVPRLSWRLGPCAWCSSSRPRLHPLLPTA